MPLRLKVNIAGNSYYIKTVVGSATTGNTIMVQEEPQEVRIFSASKPWGELIPQGTGGWSYDSSNETVTLPRTLTSGEVAVAFVGDKFLFESIVSAAGLPGFVTNTGQVADRTKVQNVEIVNEDTNTRYLNVRITGFTSFVNDGTINNGWFSVKKANEPDANYVSGTNISSSTPFNITTPASDGSFDAIEPQQQRTITLKCVANENLPVQNYRNWYFTLEYIAQDTR